MDRHAAHNRPMGLARVPAKVLVVMGVSSSGKTTVARLLAERLGWHYQEGDALHPAENVAKMSAGTPLSDEDRAPWLRRIADRIDLWRSNGKAGAITCSALKRAYRQVIIGDRPDVGLIHLRGSRELIGRGSAKGPLHADSIARQPVRHLARTFAGAASDHRRCRRHAGPHRRRDPAAPAAGIETGARVAVRPATKCRAH